MNLTVCEVSGISGLGVSGKLGLVCGSTCPSELVGPAEKAEVERAVSASPKLCFLF